MLDDEDVPVPPGNEVEVCGAGRSTVVRLAKISDLFTGEARPPALQDLETPAYVYFFAMIELTAAHYCWAASRRVTDKEFERLYDLLRRRPDGTDRDDLFSFLQAAVRLYMSLHAVSRLEFEAVLRRLARSARTFSLGPASRNYLELALLPLLEPEGLEELGGR